MLSIIIICILAGLFLTSIEILLPDSFYGVIGSVFLITAVVISYQTGGISMGAIVFGSMIVSLFTVLGMGYLIFPKLSWTKKYFEEAAKYGRSVLVHDGKPIMGKIGMVYKRLKPGGLITIDGIRYKAVSQDGILENGTPVVVIGHSLARLLVKKTTSIKH